MQSNLYVWIAMSTCSLCRETLKVCKKTTCYNAKITHTWLSSIDQNSLKSLALAVKLTTSVKY